MGQLTIRKFQKAEFPTHIKGNLYEIKGLNAKNEN